MTNDGLLYEVINNIEHKVDGHEESNDGWSEEIVTQPRSMPIVP
jgi:hypothetical protein